MAKQRVTWRPAVALTVVLAGWLLAACAIGPAASAPIVFRTATPYASPTPRPSATPRPVVTLEPTTAAGADLSVATPVPAPAASTPVAALPSPSPVPSVPVTPTAIPRPAPFTPENAYRHVEELAISIGVRAAGSDGEARAADYVANYLEGLSYSVSRQQFGITTFVDNGSSLTLQSGVEPRQPQTLAMYFSGTGQIEAPLVMAGLGSLDEFQAGQARGKIAVIERGGGLSFIEKARNASNGGAVGVVIYNDREGPLQGTLAEPLGLPVVSISQTDGVRIRRQIEQRSLVRAVLSVNATTEIKPSFNIAATLPGLKPNLPIIVVGAHYDTVPAGPGANDNGSGVGVMLELARSLSHERRAELRFIAFGSEEIGQLGSKAYVDRLTLDEKSRIVAMINLDMVGVGPALAVGGTEDLVVQTIAIAERQGVARVGRLAATRTANSDHLSFMGAGISAVYLHRPDDPNYHQAADRAQFVRTEALSAVGDVATQLIDQLAQQRMG